MDGVLSAVAVPPAPAPPRAAAVSVVVPVFNARRHLHATVPPLLEAARHAGDVEVVFVDNGSTDGSYEALRALAGGCVRVVRLEKASIAAVRNFGARHATGEYLSFLDADCVVAPGYFGEARAALDRTGAAATGCEVNLPPRPHWIEAAWHRLHYVGRERYVAYLNSANFFVSRAAFEAVGGFDESLVTGEDAEIGARMVAAGLRIYESPRVDVLHLGNPRSIHQFYRRNVWHALGMFATTGLGRLDRPTAMMFAHLALSLAGIAALLWGPWSPGARAAVAAALQLAAPAATVTFRALQTRRGGGAVAAWVVLYWLYFWARLQAVVVIAAGGAGRYRK